MSDLTFLLANNRIMRKIDDQFADHDSGACELIIYGALRRMLKVSGSEKTAARAKEIAEICARHEQNAMKFWAGEERQSQS